MKKVISMVIIISIFMSLCSIDVFAKNVDLSGPELLRQYVLEDVQSTSSVFIKITNIKNAFNIVLY